MYLYEQILHLYPDERRKKTQHITSRNSTDSNYFIYGGKCYELNLKYYTLNTLVLSL